MSLPPVRPVDPLTAGALVVAVLAVSSSGPLIVYAAAPALAIAFWRNALAAATLAPVAATRQRRELGTLLRGREGMGRGRGGDGGAELGAYLSVAAGVALAAHFGTWVPSVTLTSIATATALVATQPVWQGLIARAQGRRLPRRAWAGIALAVAGAVAATGADATVSARAVAGDLLAVAGGVAGAVYTAAGERVRATTSTTAYTTVCYGVCTLVLGAVCLLGRVPLGGFPATAWLAIAALAVGPQLLGHSMFSYALRRVSATTVSLLYLLEVPGAALLGWLWLGQLPRPGAWPGLVLLVIGVAVVVYQPGGVRRSPRARPGR